MQVHVEREDRELELDFTGTAKELMDEIDVNPEAVIVVRNGEVVTEDAELENEDEVEFVSIVSGG